ncbi:MAG: DUF2179 domain-containing protein [Sedimentisphaerales bacterium]|jgi:uncharacterized protein YebE (UPF0316 family)|nr:DUF2179 domain-containing protein [Sedimentisphaerales bacterium]HNY76890.1 DUF2179 domain-containing protein [Sedimentisphaerales bacterium]HOC62744.1 DUF2179 domain-containing protein [Sedimentisphaerales bacterium]HOH62664.1 DUF2179 domain-containing protein [Sedimentisphaerales bacterium]HPY49531.1 DUF2179 domain-containing protein [Sedimentisphaerales bacterium]
MMSIVASLTESNLFAWGILPALIFLARICDVTLGTVRLIFVSRGFKYLAPVVGFFEVLIWILAIGQIMQNLSNWICYLAYAGGFATGNYVGMRVAEKLSLGIVLIRIITQRGAHALLDRLRKSDYGVTSLDGEGAAGPVQVIFTIVPRREVGAVVELVKAYNPKAFYSIEEVGFVERGVFPIKKDCRFIGLERFLRPFRKGK